MGGGRAQPGQEILAYELTALVHSKEEAEKAQETARALFSSGGAAGMPTAELTEADLENGAIDVLTLLVKTGLCPSKSEARRAVTQGGVEVDGEKVTDIEVVFPAEKLTGEGVVVRRGKKTFKRAVLKA